MESCARLGGAIILAGGDSSRLGYPKPLLELEGVPLIEIMVRRLSLLFEQITVVTDRQELFAGLPVKLTGDLLAGDVKSPLRGIHAGLSLSDLPFQFVAACDMPFINLELVRYMSSFARSRCRCPRIGSYYQPLHAFYSRSCIDPIREQYELGECKVTAFYDKIKVHYIGYAEIARFDRPTFLFQHQYLGRLPGSAETAAGIKRLQLHSACPWGKEL